VGELYPGETERRQPVHTVYGGAHLFQAETCAKLGSLAQRALNEYAPDCIDFAKAIGLPGAERLTGDATQIGRDVTASAEDQTLRHLHRPEWLARTVYARTLDKLDREPVEDFRIDFEDGYGHRSDAEEDGHAVAAAAEVARGMVGGQLPSSIGIRIKPLSLDLAARSIRTLDLFVTELLAQSNGKLPANFVVTLPKITTPEQVAALAQLLDRLEASASTRLPRGVLKMEIMMETTQSMINDRGECNVLPLVQAAQGRCVAAHFGTYDYTAACQITAAHQQMNHPACVFAKNMMQVALGGTGIWLSDGATNLLPVPPHRAANKGLALSARQNQENRAAVHQGWRLHYRNIQHSLRTGFYQGWDLHPAQLPARFAAVYAFFLEDLDAASERLKNFVARAAQATLVGERFDDAATGQGLLNYFLRATTCGALLEDEAQQLSGLTIEELRSGSFLKILEGRTDRK
jgi:citrate lyase beta subunit